MKLSFAMRVFFQSLLERFAGVVIVAGILLCATGLPGQQAPSESGKSMILRGTVLDVQGRPVADAIVSLQAEHAKITGAKIGLEARTDSHGAFSFQSVSHGVYLVVAWKAGLQSARVPVDGRSFVTLVMHSSLESSMQESSIQGETLKGAVPAMEFSDQPHFSVAGVTDWTAAGGHGSDTTLRASESVTNAAVTLKPDVSVSIPATAEKAAQAKARERALLAAVQQSPQAFAANESLGEFYVNQGRFKEAVPVLEKASIIQPNQEETLYPLALAYEGTGALARARDTIGLWLAEGKSADAYRLAGRLDEKLGDSLMAVQEFEQAATLEPSEPNEFEWASELLVHRAIWQAEEVFRKGAAAYPMSLRMQAGLGAALFAGSRYEEAASQVCKASDIEPTAASPYLLLGEIEIAAPKTLGCVKPKLARFVTLHPESATANYLYAMALLKEHPGTADENTAEPAKGYLHRAVSLDPKCSEAYLELGILASAQKDNQSAIRLYMEAIQADPTSADAHYRLGMAYDRTGETVKAEREFALHNQIKQQQAEATDAQRKAVKQFLFAKPNDPAAKPMK